MDEVSISRPLVEVFKTNVSEKDLAGLLIDQLHKTFTGYKANFDLEDCDRILRVECVRDNIQSSFIIDFLKALGVEAEVLPDSAG